MLTPGIANGGHARRPSEIKVLEIELNEN